LFYQLRITTQFNPVSVNFGSESREDFIARIVRDYPAVRYMQENAKPEDRLLLLGDGRGYLCLPQCVPDPDHFRWAKEISVYTDLDGLGQWFADSGISHVLLSWEDLDFLLQHDPEGVVEQAALNLIAWREAGCLETVFEDEWNELYSVACVP
jgi:hypothetical protein